MKGSILKTINFVKFKSKEKIKTHNKYCVKKVQFSIMVSCMPSHIHIDNILNQSF